MNEIMLEMSLILVLILLNGLFAASEKAVVSARTGRLQALVADGDAGARRVLALQREPGRFLSTVQIGITLVATVASAGAGAVRFLLDDVAHRVISHADLPDLVVKTSGTN